MKSKAQKATLITTTDKQATIVAFKAQKIRDYASLELVSRKNIVSSLLV